MTIIPDFVPVSRIGEGKEVVEVGEGKEIVEVVEVVEVGEGKEVVEVVEVDTVPRIDGGRVVVDSSDCSNVSAGFAICSKELEPQPVVRENARSKQIVFDTGGN